MKFQVGDVTKTSMETSWDEPENPNGVVTKYTVQAVVLEKLYDTSFTHTSSDPVLAVNEELDSQQRTYTFTDLKPSTKYELTVFATSVVGKGDTASIQQSTDSITREDISSPPYLQQVGDSQKTPTTVEIDIPLSTSEFVSAYLVGVKLISSKRKRQAGVFDHYDKSPTMYVAAELAKSELTDDSSFVIGDNQTYGSYYNPPLQEGQTYQLYTAFASRINDSYALKSWSEGTSVTLPISESSLSKGANTNTVIVIISVSVVVVIAIVIVGLVIKMRLQKKTPETTTKSPSQDKHGGDIAGSSGQIQLSSV
ncbi:receptor-type tyrosine-protein phosphatase U-like [Amphiura filiformis]|uniref:receptor-type tyrosine-protein phosphatase U-like n=1 Tax=Amphiura filiformis TaxID=82378 RepID=UPI003B210A09